MDRQAEKQRGEIWHGDIVFICTLSTSDKLNQSAYDQRKDVLRKRPAQIILKKDAGGQSHPKACIMTYRPSLLCALRARLLRGSGPVLWSPDQTRLRQDSSTTVLANVRTT